MALGNSAGISFSGLSSGIDTASLIEQLSALERRPVVRLQAQQALLQTRKSAYDTFKSILVSLNGAVSSFNNPGAFDTFKGTSSNTDLATITASANASIGIRELKVNRLASAHRISSSAQQSSTAALGYAGQFKIGESTISVVATDTLQSIATKINESGADATASIVDGGAGNAYLTLASKTSGVSNQLELQDLNVSGPISTRDGVLAKLGLVAVSAFSGDLPALTSGVLSSTTDPLAGVMGVDPGPRTINIGSQSITVDFAVETAETLAQKLTALNGIEARVTGGRLEVIADSAIDSPDLVELGFSASTANITLAAQSQTQLVAAQDAEYVLDGITLTSSSNTLKDVIPGTTITLKAADPTKTVNLTVERDTESVMNLAKGLVTAYNRVNQFIRDNSGFDGETYESGILFGDSVASQVSSQLNTTLFNSVAGLTTGLSNLTQIGFSIDESGNLSVDDTELRTAIESNPTGVANLLRSTGTSSNSAMTYLSGSNKTKSGTYAVNITRLATQTTSTASIGQTGSTAAEEVISFSGAAFGTTGVALVVSAGSSQQNIVDLINSDTRLKDTVQASIVEGKLTITSKRYGAASDFTVSSSAAAAANTSGIGTTAVHIAGLDIEGTINGEAATGSGRFLLGNVGNANTEGLQIEYTGSTLGNVGSMTYSTGMGGMIFSALDTFINFQDGLFVSTAKSLDEQIADLDSQIDRINERADQKTVELRARFAAMEAAMSRSQSQLAQLTQALSGMSS
ncbi:MAG: flagellar filament capping protein FliD [Chthonomonas sp.]|nr:flagellar filament capping protein FliD [Chthonomonas sp.]